MTAVDAVSAMQAVATPDVATPAGLSNAVAPTTTETFGDLIARGVADVETKVQHADELVRAFAVDDSIPVHQVTIALQEARLAVEMAMQVRARLVEGYREIMNMQL